jgi:hypothetical protein
MSESRRSTRARGNAKHAGGGASTEAQKPPPVHPHYKDKMQAPWGPGRPNGCPYEALELDPQVVQVAFQGGHAVIQKVLQHAWKTTSRKFHPDKRPEGLTEEEATARQQLINAAKEFLEVGHQRTKYDLHHDHIPLYEYAEDSEEDPSSEDLSDLSDAESDKENTPRQSQRKHKRQRPAAAPNGKKAAPAKKGKKAAPKKSAAPKLAAAQPHSYRNRQGKDN